MQDHAEAQAGGFAKRHNLLCCGTRSLNRLFKQDVLAGADAFLHDLQPCVRRREDDDSVDGFVLDQRIDRGRQRKAVFRTERLAPPLGWRINRFDLENRRQILQRLAVKLGHHPQSDDAYSQSFFRERHLHAWSFQSMGGTCVPVNVFWDVGLSCLAR